MKEIKALIGPQRLAALHAALRAVPGFPGMTVGRADGYPAPAPLVKHSIKEELTDHSARLRVEMLVPDELADRLFDVIVASVSSGSPGDSIVWITDVTRAALVHKTV